MVYRQRQVQCVSYQNTIFKVIAHAVGTIRSDVSIPSTGAPVSSIPRQMRNSLDTSWYRRDWKRRSFSQDTTPILGETNTTMKRMRNSIRLQRGYGKQLVGVYRRDGNRPQPVPLKNRFKLKELHYRVSRFPSVECTNLRSTPRSYANMMFF